MSESQFRNTKATDQEDKKLQKTSSTSDGRQEHLRKEIDQHFVSLAIELGIDRTFDEAAIDALANCYIRAVSRIAPESHS